MATTRFSWGKVVDLLVFDFEGTALEVVKYHPWMVVSGTVLSGNPDLSETLYSVQALHQSFPSLDEAVIAWITFRRLGQNQGALVAGISKALDLPQLTGGA